MFFFVSKLTLALLFRKEMAHSRRDSSKQTTTQPQTDPTVARELRYLIMSSIILTLMLAQDINKLWKSPNSSIFRNSPILGISRPPDYLNSCFFFLILNSLLFFKFEYFVGLSNFQNARFLRPPTTRNVQFTRPAEMPELPNRVPSPNSFVCRPVSNQIPIYS